MPAMFHKASLALTALAAAALPCIAAPVEFDTPDAHVIVLRSVDAWSPDNGTSADSLATYRKHEFAFELQTETRELRGYPTVFQRPTDDPTVHRVEQVLGEGGMRLANRMKFQVRVFKPVTIRPAEYPAFAAGQAALFEQGVYAQGDPKTLAGKASARKFFGTILAVAAVGVAGDRFGASAAGGLVGSGVAGDVYQLGAAGRAAMLPLELPAFAPEGYASVDVRKVVQGITDRVGQVVIAYRGEKTPEAEQEALARAIGALAGLGTTAEEIEQARAADVAQRQALWDACAAAGKCNQ
ncbi:hypothetical protein DBR42_04720 [Pelomonas sp. HMWF004]|nr:hypothetical protein DBR42_04720 [Pelomonas sp. HMWF004]